MGLEEEHQITRVGDNKPLKVNVRVLSATNRSLEQAVEFDTDVLGSLLKALVFGALISLIATYRGYHSGRSAEAVGRSTTSTVVTASVCILVANYIVTSLWEF